MEWVIGVALVVFLAWWFINNTITTSQANQQADPDRFLNEWFNGDEQVVITQHSGTLPTEDIVKGGNERGYKLISATQLPYPKTGQQQMIFEKT